MKIPCCRGKIRVSQGLAQLVARTPGGREVASSSLVSLTTWYNRLMKYAFVILAILAIWLGTILLTIFNSAVGMFLPIFAIILTVILFVIGFGKKQ